jgi:hypothetical protein
MESAGKKKKKSHLYDICWWQIAGSEVNWKAESSDPYLGEL